MLSSLLSLSLITINPQEMEKAQEVVKTHLIEQGCIHVENMTQKEIMIEFMLYQAVDKNSFMIKSIWSELLQLAGEEEDFDQAEIENFENMMGFISEELLKKILPEIKAILLEEFSEEEIGFLFAQSLDSTAQRIEKKFLQKASRFILTIGDLLKEKLAEIDLSFDSFYESE